MADLRDQAVAVGFYDSRFQSGYMSGWSQVKRQRIASLIAKLGLPQQGRALDFGCGTGVLTEVLAAVLPRWRVEGTDLSSVAVSAAAKRVPQCRFFTFPNGLWNEGQFDLIFTHHVLEHVSDIAATARLLAGIARPQASMLHILPCGNAGSFEHQVCLLRTDGIRYQPERLFFYEEEGHLRRLDTEDVVALWRDDGFRLGNDWYASHRVGALEQRTAYGWEDVLAFADPDKAVDARSRRTLRGLRLGMIVLWAARKPLAVVRNKTRFGCHSLRDYLLLVAGLAAYPAAWVAERTLGQLESREWSQRNRDRAAGEMFVHLIR